MEESATRKRQSKQRTEKILNAALELFCDQGIEDTSIEQIASHAGVGPATIYRYFDNKAELCIQTGITYWQKISEKYLLSLTQSTYQNALGRERLAHILDIFVLIFKKESGFLKFLKEFDVFVQKYQISPERLSEYEACILNLKPYVTDALELGLEDGSLAFPYSTDEIYFSLTHTMLSLMQKLASDGNILSSDSYIDFGLQLQITKELLLKGLTPTHSFH